LCFPPAAKRTDYVVTNDMAQDDTHLVWVRLKQVAKETKKTVYHLKHDLLSDYLRLQLKSLAIQMTFA